MCEDPYDSETSHIYFINPLVRGEDWLADNSHTNSQGSADNKRGGSIEAHLYTAQIMAPDSLVRLCYIYIVISRYPQTQGRAIRSQRTNKSFPTHGGSSARCAFHFRIHRSFSGSDSPQSCCQLPWSCSSKIYGFSSWSRCSSDTIE